MIAFRLAGADDADSVDFDAGKLRWVGRADDDPLAPRLVGDSDDATLANAVERGDARAIAPFVSTVAMPAGLLLALAQRCFERDSSTAIEVASGRGFFDRRWLRALQQVVLAHAETPVEPPRATLTALTRLDGALEQMMPLPDALALTLKREGNEGSSTTLALFSHGELRTVDEWPAPALVGLPTRAHAPADEVAVTLTGDEAVSLLLYDARGQVIARCPPVDAGAVFAWSRAGDRTWLHGKSEHVALTMDGVVRRLPRAQPTALHPLFVLDGWLATFANASVRGGHALFDELRWVRLDGSEDDRTRPWFQEARQLQLLDGRLWIVSGKGVWGLHPLEEPIFRWAIGPSAMTVDGETLWVSFHNSVRHEHGVACIDLVTSGERWVQLSDDTPSRIVRVPGGVLACGPEWRWIRDDGTLVASGRGGHSVTTARIGGRFAFAALDELLFIDERGELVRRILPADRLSLVGAIGELALAAGAAALHAFDGDGRRVALLPRQQDAGEIGAVVRTPAQDARWSDAGVVDGDRLFVRGRQALLGWTAPAPTRDERPPVLEPPPRRATVRGQRLHHVTVENRGKREVKYTEPGLSISQAWHFGAENQYVGDVDDEVAAIELSDGAVVTLHRCAIEAGGLELWSGSTLILIDCDESQAQATTMDPSSFVVRVSG